VLGLDEKTAMLKSSQVIINFSFPLFSSATPLNYIMIDGMIIDFPVFKSYLAQYNTKIYAWARALPKGKMHLLVPNGQFYLKGPQAGDPVTFKINLNLDQDHLNVQGSWEDKDKFNYELSGDIRSSGFDLDKLTLENSRSSINLWGSWHDNHIDWKGFIFYNKFYILDINGNVEVQDKDIVLKKLSFSVNGDPVGALGHCSRQGLFQCDADIALKNLGLHLHAQNTPQGLVFKGAADVDGTHLDFEDLTALIINGNSLKVRIKQIQGSLSIQGTQYRLPFENLGATLNFENPYRQTITISGGVFAGHIQGRIFLDTSSLPWQIKSQGSFDGINMAQGLLSGTFDFQSSKNTRLSGTLALHNGNFNDTHFQEWTAKTLQMPSLEHISGADLHCRFTINGNSKTVEDIKLNTNDFDLSGFFHLDADDFVSSQGSVRFSKKLLSESTVGRQIIGLVRGAWTLPFEFRLSGNMYRMNFQWDNSPLKDKVRRHLFSFFERMIDQRMDAHPYYNVTIPSESVSPG
jgi:hypothetical protein